MRFSLLHATYRAGADAVAVRQAWLTSARRPDLVEHIFSSNADDEISQGTPEIAAGLVGPPVEYVTAVRNWNAAAAASTGELLVVIADDLWPCDGWDDELNRACRSLNPKRVPFVVQVKDTDEVRGGLIRHPIVSRRYFERFGLWHPGFTGYSVDQDFTIGAHHHGVVVDARHITWDHRHPSRGVEPSESHQRMRNDPAIAAGVKLYGERWPPITRHVWRRFYVPTDRPGQMSAPRRLARAALARAGYVRAGVPESVKRRLKPAR